MLKPTLLAFATLFWFTSHTNAEPTEAALENWGQWRGPLANGTAPLGDPPLQWSEGKNIKWKVAIPGQGSASPIVWNDRIFILTAIPTNRTPDGAGSAERRPSRGGRGLTRDKPENVYQFVVLCLDRNTGKTLWQRVAREEVPHEGGHPTNTFASGSPTTDGNLLYASFGSYGVYCYDLDGHLKWERDLGDMQTRNGFGEGTSPTLYKDSLVINWDHEGASFIAVLDAKTGETRWRVDRDEPTTWNTPLVVEHAGRTQIITNGTNRSRSYDLKTGELIWECGGQATNPIPSPVLLDDLAICMTGYRGYAVYAIPLDSQGDISNTDRIAWRRTDAGPYISSPVLVDDTLYFTKGRDAILYSVNARTGEPIIESTRLPLSVLYSSPVSAKGRIYTTDRSGKTLVIKHAPKLEILATNQLEEGIDASPAITGNQLFLRTAGHLYCIEE